MTRRYLALAISTVFLGACGGGGGGEGNPATSAPPPSAPTVPTVPGTPTAPVAQPPYALSQSPISAKFVTGYPAKVELAATQTTPFAGVAYIRITPDNDIIESVEAKPQRDGTFDVTVLPSAKAKAGHYTGQITVDICKDAACAASFDGAPFKVPYVIDILSEEGGATPSNLTALTPLGGAGDWGTFQANAAHTGFVPVSLAPSRFSVRWKYENPAVRGAQLRMSDIVSSAGRLYFSTGMGWDASNLGHDVYALNEQDGTLAWKHDFGNLQEPATNPPGVANGKVYMVAGAQASTAMYGFDAGDGRQLFSTPIESQWPRYLAPVVYGGSVYSEGGMYEGMYAFDANSGARQWFSWLEQIDSWSPAVDADNTYVYLNNTLSVNNRRTGVSVGKITGPVTVWPHGATPLIGAPNNVIVSTSEALMNFDPATRSLRWSIDGAFLDGPAYDNKEIFVVRAAPFALEARSEADGSKLWSWEPPANTSGWAGNVVLTKNLVFVSTHTTTFAIDRTTRQMVWSHPFPGKLTLSANGVLYIYGDSTILAVNVN